MSNSVRYLGLDLGSKTLGLALSDELNMFAFTLTTLRFKNDDYEYACDEVIKIAHENNVKNLILGYPKHMNGDLGIRAKISEDFKLMIESKSDLTVILIDERLTSITVNKAMIEANVRRENRKQKKDELAAVIILQNYLDGLKNRRN
ncbi:MAG: Holliday junction resolvase RuvX [Anaeroplasmataceae bacterium]